MMRPNKPDDMRPNKYDDGGSIESNSAKSAIQRTATSPPFLRGFLRNQRCDDPCNDLPSARLRLLGNANRRAVYSAFGTAHCRIAMVVESLGLS